MERINTKIISNSNIWAFIFSLMFLSSYGCTAALVAAGAGAGVGTVAYIKGELVTEINAPMETAMRAVHNALSVLKLRTLTEQSDAFTGKVTARSAHDDDITILLTRITDTNTEISIRVGIFGDRKFSQAILDEVKKQLIDIL